MRPAGAWNGKHVQSPSILYRNGAALVAYEGWPDDVAPAGIGLDVGRERWIEVDKDHVVFDASLGETPPAQVLTIRNNGIGDLTIDRMALFGDGFSITGPRNPTVIPPDKFAFWLIDFIAENVGAYEGLLVIANDDPARETVTVKLSGTVE